MAIKEGYTTRTPCEEIEKARLTEEEIGTLTLAQCEALLKAAASYRHRVTGRSWMLPYVVISLYGGVRAAELERLDWSAVNIENGTVIVGGALAKTRRRRVVDLPENALSWLRLLDDSEKTGKICGRGHAETWRRFRRIAAYAIGSKAKPDAMPWPSNALRHTAASMHYAMYQNEALLQAQLGHENAAMPHRHYRALKVRSEAAGFYPSCRTCCDDKDNRYHYTSHRLVQPPLGEQKKTFLKTSRSQRFHRCSKGKR